MGALLAIGLLSGAMVEEYFFLDVILRGFPAEQWLLAHARFGALHPYTVIPTAAVGMLLIFLTFVLDRDVRSPRALGTVGEVGDPDPADRVFGRPTTTVREWCERARGKADA
jgi:hypothetical protein